MPTPKVILLHGIISLALLSCTSTEDDLQVMTVNGSMNASEMDATLIHEHVIVDWIGADSTGYHRWNREEVVERVLPFFREAAEKGVSTIFDLTPAYLGRDPFILAELSQQSGIQVLTNTGYYGAVENTYMPEHAYRESAEQIAERWIDEFKNGIDDSGIRPGFMKISVAGEQPLSDLHKKTVDAAGITHLETGLTIVSHTAGDVPALEQVERLKRKGVSPTAWVWTHAQTGSVDGNIQAAQEGAWISLDGINSQAGENGNIEWFADRLAELQNAGFLNQVLISHDAGYYEAGSENGGSFRRYTDIFDDFIPALKERNFSDEEIEQLLVRNPQEAYGIRVRIIE